MSGRHPFPRWLSVVLRGLHLATVIGLGAALLGGVAAGEYADVTAAVNATVRMKQRVEPQAAQTAAYAPRFALYERVYPALRELLWQC